MYTIIYEAVQKLTAAPAFSTIKILPPNLQPPLEGGG